MRKYVTEEICRPQQLIRYFGQELAPCGQCDVCKRKRILENTAVLSVKILEHLKAPQSLPQLLGSFDESLHEKIREQLKVLLIEEKISFSSGKYSLRG